MKTIFKKSRKKKHPKVDSLEPLTALTKALTEDGRLYIIKSFLEINSIIGASLPSSATKNKSWWTNNKEIRRSSIWLNAGYCIEDQDRILITEKVTFKKIEEKDKARIDKQNGWLRRNWDLLLDETTDKHKKVVAFTKTVLPILTILVTILGLVFTVFIKIEPPTTVYTGGLVPEYDVAITYYNQLNYKKTEEYLEIALDKQIALSGSYSLDVAIIHNSLGLLYLEMAYYDVAMENFNCALIIFQNKGAQDDIAAVNCNIGEVCKNKGDFAMALVWYKKALVIWEKMYGTDDLKTAIVYNNMAELYLNDECYNDALSLYQKALDIYSKALDTNHPDIAMLYSNMANALFLQRNFNDAMEWFMKALAIREKVLLPNDPDMASSYYNIAMVYYYQNEYDQALEWHFKALAVYEKVFGTDNPNTAISYTNIGLVYDAQGEYEKALSWFQKAYKIQLSKQGATHPNTMKTKEYMQHVYNNCRYAISFEEWLKTIE